MKGHSSFFDSYNGAGSSSVGIVKSEKVVEKIGDNPVKIPTTGIPNSVTIVEKNGNITAERYYDEKGDAYLDIDYTDHGNPKTHPTVPHQHEWHKDENGNLHREGWTKIKK